MGVLDPVTITVNRRAGSWVDGLWVPGTPSQSTITASRPQPVGPETLDLLPEQARSSAKFEIFADDTEDALHLIEYDDEATPADTVEWGGRTYLVTGVEDWDGVALGHRAYVLLAFGPDEEVST